MPALADEITRFLKRNYRRDIGVLNRALAKPRCATAGFTLDVPPSVLTGDPLSVVPGRSIAVFGLNPKCLGLEAARAQDDVVVAKRLIDAGDLEGYRQRRASYFEPGDPQYNPKHFNRLIERIQLGLLGAAKASTEGFGRQAAMFDLLPWWSDNIGEIDAGRCSTALEPLAAWKGLIDCFLNEKRPVAIVVNGSGFRAWTEELFDVALCPFHYTVRRSDGSEAT